MGGRERERETDGDTVMPAFVMQPFMHNPPSFDLVLFFSSLPSTPSLTMSNKTDGTFSDSSFEHSEYTDKYGIENA